MIRFCKWRSHGTAHSTVVRAFSPMSRTFLAPCPIVIRCKRSCSSRKTLRRRNQVVSLGKATPSFPSVFVTATFHPCLSSLSETGGKSFTTKLLIVSSLWSIVRLLEPFQGYSTDSGTFSHPFSVSFAYSLTSQKYHQNVSQKEIALYLQGHLAPQDHSGRKRARCAQTSFHEYTSVHIPCDENSLNFSSRPAQTTLHRQCKDYHVAQKDHHLNKDSSEKTNAFSWMHLLYQKKSEWTSCTVALPP
jgi:hypothetical protein